MRETAKALRTWFVTLTLSPASHNLMLMRACHRLAGMGEDFDTYSAERQFQERHAEISAEVTLWLKRVRKEAAVDARQTERKADGCEATKGQRCTCHPLSAFNVPLRYVLVAEAHKSGLPHYHLLVHEGLDERPIRARHLKNQWRLGFSDVKLVAQDEENRHAAYVAKYLAKSVLARVRASMGYGHIGDETRPKGIIFPPEKNVKTLPDPPNQTQPDRDQVPVLGDCSERECEERTCQRD